MKPLANELKNQEKLKLLVLSLLLVSIALIILTINIPSEEEIILINNLIFLQYSNLEPLIIIVFYLMAIWPAVQASLLYGDGREKRIPAWPFILASFFTGAYALSVYILVRESKKAKKLQNRLQRLFDSNFWGIILAIFTVGLFFLGLLWGNPQRYIDALQKYLFVRVMTLDFLLFTLITPITIYIHSVNNSIDTPSYIFFLGMIPILGALYYILKVS
ncbi:MAG: hypothetical protein ACXACK_03255 [Candidatus Hodarchaeales archaeon]|jgi:hypothetical protein